MVEEFEATITFGTAEPDTSKCPCSCCQSGECDCASLGVARHCGCLECEKQIIGRFLDPGDDYA